MTDVDIPVATEPVGPIEDPAADEAESVARRPSRRSASLPSRTGSIPSLR